MKSVVNLQSLSSVSTTVCLLSIFSRLCKKRRFMCWDRFRQICISLAEAEILISFKPKNSLRQEGFLHWYIPVPICTVMKYKRSLKWQTDKTKSMKTLVKASLSKKKSEGAVASLCCQRSFSDTGDTDGIKVFSQGLEQKDFYFLANQNFNNTPINVLRDKISLTCKWG